MRSLTIPKSQTLPRSARISSSSSHSDDVHDDIKHRFQTLSNVSDYVLVFWADIIGLIMAIRSGKAQKHSAMVSLRNKISEMIVSKKEPFLYITAKNQPPYKKN